MADPDAALSPPPTSTPIILRHASLPPSLSSTPPSTASPSLDRPHSSFASLHSPPDPLHCLDAAFTKLLSGLRTRPTNDYCRRVLQHIEHSQAALMRPSPASSSSAAPTNGIHSLDILDFAGVPYQAPAPAPGSPTHGGGSMLSPAGKGGETGDGSPFITDLCVHHVAKKGGADGFTLVERTVSGQHRATLTRGSGPKVLIGYKRGSFLRSSTATSKQGEAEKPVTSMSIFFRDTPEEAPYGFTAIERTTAGGDASLHPLVGSMLGRQPYLAFTRGGWRAHHPRVAHLQTARREAAAWLARGEDDAGG